MRKKNEEEMREIKEKIEKLEQKRSSEEKFKI